MNDRRYMVNAFTGVQEVKHDYLNEVHGLLDDPALSLRRIPGKVPFTTGTFAAVWGVHQLKFREGRGLIISATTTYGTLQPEQLTGIVFTPPVFETNYLPPSERPVTPNDEYPPSEEDQENWRVTEGNYWTRINVFWGEEGGIIDYWQDDLPANKTLTAFALVQSQGPYDLDFGVETPEANYVNVTSTELVNSTSYPGWGSRLYKITLSLRDNLNAKAWGDFNFRLHLSAHPWADEVRANLNQTKWHKHLTGTVRNHELNYELSGIATMKSGEAKDLSIRARSARNNTTAWKYAESGVFEIVTGAGTLSPDTFGNGGWTDGMKTMALTVTAGAQTMVIRARTTSGYHADVTGTISSAITGTARIEIVMDPVNSGLIYYTDFWVTLRALDGNDQVITDFNGAGSLSSSNTDVPWVPWNSGDTGWVNGVRRFRGWFETDLMDSTLIASLSGTYTEANPPSRSLTGTSVNITLDNYQLISVALTTTSPILLGGSATFRINTYTTRNIIDINPTKNLRLTTSDGQDILITPASFAAHQDPDYGAGYALYTLTGLTRGTGNPHTQVRNNVTVFFDDNHTVEDSSSVYIKSQVRKYSVSGTIPASRSFDPVTYPYNDNYKNVYTYLTIPMLDAIHALHPENGYAIPINEGYHYWGGRGYRKTFNDGVIEVNSSGNLPGNTYIPVVGGARTIYGTDVDDGFHWALGGGPHEDWFIQMWEYCGSPTTPIAKNTYAPSSLDLPGQLLIEVTGDSEAYAFDYTYTIQGSIPVTVWWEEPSS